MRHYGAEPPWRGYTRYGEWRWVPPDDRLWLPEQGYWELSDEPFSLMGQLTRAIRDFYLPALQADLNRQFYGGSVLLDELAERPA